MTPTEARNLLRAAGISTADLAATARALGDVRTQATIYRGITRMLAGSHDHIPWYAEWIVRREIDIAQHAELSTEK